MIKNLFQTAVFLVIVLVLPLSLYSQESFTITTYYPAPFGIYQHMVANALGVGNTNGVGGVEVTDTPDPTNAAQAGDVWIAGDVGIGTTTPQSTLSVAGSAAIGTTYAATIAAPADNLLVEGDLGVGVTNPNFTDRSDVTANHIKLIPTNNPTHTAQGVIYYAQADKVLKYYDSTGTLRTMGGVQLEADQTVTQTSVDVLVSTTTTADCPEGYVLTGIGLSASCRLGSGMICQAGTEDDVFKVKKVMAHCTPIQ